MIITTTCDLCGWNNDNNDGPCHRCGGQTEEKRIRGKWKTVMTKKPTMELRGFYNPAVIDGTTPIAVGAREEK